MESMKLKNGRNDSSRMAISFIRSTRVGVSYRNRSIYCLYVLYSARTIVVGFCALRTALFSVLLLSK